MKSAPLYTLLLLVCSTLLATPVQAAKQYRYNADVTGMVCAFCAYNVSKKISRLPGVLADTVNVDLDNGGVSFASRNLVDRKQLEDTFSDSGFTLDNLRYRVLEDAGPPPAAERVLSLSSSRDQVERLTPLLETLGELAANRPMRLHVRADAGLEDRLLKPLLMGRQQVIQTRFMPQAGEAILIELFAEP